MPLRREIGTLTNFADIRIRHRVLATDWEAETVIECWTNNLDTARVIADALNVRDVSVQIDQLPPTTTKRD